MPLYIASRDVATYQTKCYGVTFVCLSSVVFVVCTECIVAKRCVLEQLFLLRAYKLYMQGRF